jgi:integrase
MNTYSQEPQSRVKLLVRKAKRALRQKNLDALGDTLRPSDPGLRSDPIRILGPYRNRDTWRVVLVDGKDRKSLCIPSREDACALIAKFTQESERLQTRTIDLCLQDYRNFLIAVRQAQPSTADHVYASLASWLPGAMRVSSMTPAKAQRLYEELTQKISHRTGKVLAVATQQFFLSCAKSWGKWACKERLIPKSPFSDVAFLGRKHSRKTQLRIDEAKKLADLTQEQADAGDTDALAILLMLHLGLRQGEVGARVARDVDAQGSLLWITSGKTAKAVRRVELPACLRASLTALAHRKQPGELLFTDGPKVPGRQHFWSKLRQFCRRAAVPLVCPHSLRGLHATLAVRAGATGGLVAHALGHGSFQVTARHYATPESVADSRATRVSEALGASDDVISRLIAGLTPAQLEELKRRLASSPVSY